MLQFEAIRTEAHQNVYHPVEPYQNQDEIRRQGRYWQQIVTFFVRTRRVHSWKSLLYKFNRRQDQAFEQMLAVTRSTVKEADEASDAESDSADTDSEAEGEGGEPAMTEIQQACLSSCIESLNQTIHNREYDIALVCGLAALGVNPSSQGF
jgi:hypothetical protein